MIMIEADDDLVKDKTSTFADVVKAKAEADVAAAALEQAKADHKDIAKDDKAAVTSAKSEHKSCRKDLHRCEEG